MEVEALEPRDAGYAMAALAIGAAAEAAAGRDEGALLALAARAPRGAGPRLEAALQELLTQGVDQAKASLGAHVDQLRRSGPGAALARVHASWLADSLVDEPDETVEAVLHCLPEKVAGAVRTALARLSRQAPGGLRAKGLKAEIEPIVAERYRERAFPFAGGGLGELGAGASKELSWLAVAPPEEVEMAAREIGIRAVARAFSGISKEDLGKLCQGLPPNDSVRLVSAVVELRDTMKPEDLRPLQKLHLKLIRAGGVSPELFSDTGLAMLAGALMAKLSERARHTIAYRLPDGLGRRLLDLSAPGAVLDEPTRDRFAAELPAWMKELEAKGVAAHYGGGGSA